MKKLLTLLLSLSFLALVAGPALAVPTYFEDMIDTWEYGSTHAYVPQDPESFKYQHDLNDNIDRDIYAVTEANLILKFDYVYNGVIKSQDYIIDWNQTEEVYIDLEGNGDWHEVQDGVGASYDLAIDWLNDDGFLDVSLSVKNEGEYAAWFLDYSLVKGYYDYKPESVPEPASLFLLGAGLLGVVGARRKRN